MSMLRYNLPGKQMPLPCLEVAWLLLNNTLFKVTLPDGIACKVCT